MCPFSILAFLQPTTVDKEPKKLGEESPSLFYILVLYQLTISVYSVAVRSSCVYK